MKRSLFLAALVGGLLVTGFLASRLFSPASAPSLEQAIPAHAAQALPGSGLRMHQFGVGSAPQECLQGERFPLDAVLRNDGAQDVKLVALVGTCGCMKFTTGGETLQLPRPLAPGQSLPIRVEIDTASKGGLQRFRLDAWTETGAGPRTLSCFLEMQLQIRVPFLAMPTNASLDFDSEQISSARNCTFILYDDWPGAGLTIQEITSTAHGRLSWRVEPLAGEETIGVTRLKKRFAIQVAYRQGAVPVRRPVGAATALLGEVLDHASPAHPAGAEPEGDWISF